jgi:CRP-like cAMP-binding protein
VDAGWVLKTAGELSTSVRERGPIMLQMTTQPFSAWHRDRSMEQPTQSYKNRLLELLDADEFERLRRYLEHVSFEYKQVLYEPDTPIEWVYFPVQGVASLVNTMRDGSEVEVGTIGNEGMVGVPIVLGDKVSPTSVYVQVPGFGLRLRSAILWETMGKTTSTRTVMLHYAHAFLSQVTQLAACAHLHSVDQHCCRWLLMTHDRVQTDHFLLTQEFFAMMLGVRRTSITGTANRLKNKKIIEYTRGHVTILDRAALEKCSCECYAVMKREFDRLLGSPLGSIDREAAEIQTKKRRSG